MKKLLRLSFNETVLLGSETFSYNFFSIHIRFKPVIVKWSKTFKEVTLDLSNGLSFTSTKSNYNGSFNFSITVLGLTIIIGVV